MPLAVRRAALALVSLLAAGGPDVAPPGFTVERVADGVYALIRTDPPGFAFEANGVVIVGDRDVLVVDAQSNPDAAREALAAIRRITPKPVRRLVNTHSHFDHYTGNAVHREAFPDVEIIAHPDARADMAAFDSASRPAFLAAVPEAIADFRGRLERNRTPRGDTLTAEERASHASDIRLAEGYLRVDSTFRSVLPERLVADRLTLRHGGRTVDIRWLGRGHTRGDLVVHLPDDGILITGDLVTWPVPLVGTTSFPADYAATLERVLALGARTYVPGHGPVLRDDAYVRLVARMLGAIRDGTAAAVARGETLEEARTSVDLTEYRRAIAGESRLLRDLFEVYVAQPGVARAYEMAAERARPPA